MQNQAYITFRQLMIKGNLTELNQFICGMTPLEVQDLIAAGNHMSLYLAITHEKMNVLQWLLNLAPNIIETDAFHSSLYHAVVTDSLDMVNELIKLAPEKISRMIQKDNYSAFLHAADMGKLEIVKRLMQCAPEHSLQMMDALARENREKAFDLMMNRPIRDLVMTHQEDLRSVASFQESSMQALSPTEKAILDKLSTHYQAEFNQLGGQENIVRALRANLIMRYRRHPATVTDDKNEEIELPWDFESFRRLRLDPKTYNKALVCYYQDPIHSALRYVSKPNPWMSDSADFIQRDAHGAYSSFEMHATFICLMFLAAKDTKTPAIDGFTIETRLNMFFKELSLIARAHNWDRYRTNPITGLDEQYDDLEGDKPSCPAGVNKRLIQAVHGHPMTKFLTEQLITQEILGFVKTQFSEKITPDNVMKLRGAWNDIIETGQTSTQVLDGLNISEDCQRKFLADMSEKYGDKLTLAHIKFLLSQFETGTVFPNHATKFAGELNLDDMIQKKIASFSLPISKSSLFKPNQQNAQVETDSEQKVKGLNKP